MNPISLNEAYQFSTFSNFLNQSSAPQYNPKCIYCLHPNSIPLMNDGGSLRRCDKCKREFKAEIILRPGTTNTNTNTLKPDQFNKYQFRNPYEPIPKTQNELQSFNPDAYIHFSQQNSYYNHDFSHFK